jgi:hypothetical protein
MDMGYVTIAALFVLGVVCASNLIIAKKPDAKELIAKIAPYQGWIGAISAIWGLWWLINWILNLKVMMTWPILGITWLANSLLLIALGLLCGIGILKMFIKQPQAVEKLDATVAKLAPKQGILGLAGIVVAIWTILDFLVLKI